MCTLIIIEHPRHQFEAFQRHINCNSTVFITLNQESSGKTGISQQSLKQEHDGSEVLDSKYIPITTLILQCLI